MVPPTHNARPRLLMGRKLLPNAIFEPGTGLPTAETKVTNPPARIGAGCLRNRPPLNNPPIRGNWLPVKTSPVLRDCVVAHAVACELVSPCNFRKYREILTKCRETLSITPPKAIRSQSLKRRSPYL